MPAHPAFKMPKHYTIPAVITSLSKAFAMAILPMVTPSDADIDEALEVLGMSGHAVCSYCGDKQTQWDHFRPVVIDSKPTGYISEIQNLVPSCGPCNASKGNQPWRTWITGSAKNSPATRGIRDLDRRIAHLEAFERWREPMVIDFGTAVDQAQWARYWRDWEAIAAALKDAQPRAHNFRVRLQQQVTPDYVPATSGAGAKYVVTSPSGTTPPLPKNRAVLALVRELTMLVPVERIRQVVGPARLRAVSGQLNGDQLWARFAETHDLDPDKRKQWFVEEPIHVNGTTWRTAVQRVGSEDSGNHRGTR